MGGATDDGGVAGTDGGAGINGGATGGGEATVGLGTETVRVSRGAKLLVLHDVAHVAICGAVIPS